MTLNIVAPRSHSVVLSADRMATNYVERWEMNKAVVLLTSRLRMGFVYTGFASNPGIQGLKDPITPSPPGRSTDLWLADALCKLKQPEGDVEAICTGLAEQATRWYESIPRSAKPYPVIFSGGGWDLRRDSDPLLVVQVHNCLDGNGTMQEATDEFDHLVIDDPRRPIFAGYMPAVDRSARRLVRVAAKSDRPDDAMAGRLVEVTRRAAALCPKGEISPELLTLQIPRDGNPSSTYHPVTDRPIDFGPAVAYMMNEFAFVAGSVTALGGDGGFSVGDPRFGTVDVRPKSRSGIRRKA